MIFWLAVFTICVLGVLALSLYCAAVLVAPRRPPAVALRVAPRPAPPPAVPPDHFTAADDAETQVAARRLAARSVDAFEPTQLARPYRARLHEAKTTVRHVPAYRPTRLHAN